MGQLPNGMAWATQDRGNYNVTRSAIRNGWNTDLARLGRRPQRRHYGGGTRQNSETGRRGSPSKQAYEGFGTSPQQGGGTGGGGGGRRWTPPSPDPLHPKIAALMNPYLAKTNGHLFLPTLLDAGNITIKDLSALEKFWNEWTGRSLMCWAHVLGPCHYGDFYFWSQGGHPEQSDYTNQFVDKVVQVIGPAVSARMLALSRGTGEKKMKAEPGSTA